MACPDTGAPRPIAASNTGTTNRTTATNTQGCPTKNETHAPVGKASDSQNALPELRQKVIHFRELNRFRNVRNAELILDYLVIPIDRLDRDVHLTSNVFRSKSIFNVAHHAKILFGNGVRRKHFALGNSGRPIQQFLRKRPEI